MDDETLSTAYLRLIEIGIALSTAKNLDSLLKEILVEAKSMANADGGTVYLQTDENSLRFSIMLNDSLQIARDATTGEPIALPDVQLIKEDGRPNLSNVVSSAAHRSSTIVVDDTRTSDEFDFSDTRAFEGKLGYVSKSLLTTPFLTISGECIGVLQLLNFQDESGEVVPFSDSITPLIEALASQASVAIINRTLLDEHEELKKQLEREVDARTEELKQALTKLSEAHTILKELNTIDAVTGIRNRRYFDDVLDQEWRRARRQGYAISLLLLDIDHFKQVNDNYGHVAGDECLAFFASKVDTMFHRPSDVVARYGGDEFAVVLPYASAANAFALAEQLRQDIEGATFIADGHKLNITISIGVATIMPDDTNAPRDLIGQADNRLYNAKAGG